MNKLARSVESYLTTIRLSRSCRPETVRLYTMYLERFLEHRRRQRCQRDTITPEDVVDFLAWYDDRAQKLRGRPLSIYALDKIYDSLRAFCSWASDLGKLRINPFRFLKAPRVPKRCDRAIAPKRQVQSLLDFIEHLPEAEAAAAHASDHAEQLFRARALAVRDASFYAVTFWGGLRPGEAEAVDEQLDLDLRAGFLKVRFGKGGKERTVPIRAELRRQLVKWLRIRKTLLRRYAIHSTALFPSLPGHGRPWDRAAGHIKAAWMSRQLRERYLPALRGRGAPRAFRGRFTPHGFRHSLATWLLNAGVRLPAVQEMLGHEDPATTMIYYHMRPEQLKRAIARAH